MSDNASGNVVQAAPDQAAPLAELYAKAFRATGFTQFTTEDKREELIVWLKKLCEEGKIWFMRDELGPLVLGHYEPEKDEIITIATRDGMEGSGHATKMFQDLLVKFPSLKVRPVTRGGKALAAKCGFSPSEEDSVWVRKHG